jgi:metal-sulfur cluster biosynthetic enzyme
MNTPLTQTEILETLRQVIDPEVGCNIVDLGLVYSASCQDGKAVVTMTLTTQGCPMHESLCGGAQNALLTLPGVTEAEVQLVWEPPWNPSMMTEDGRAIVATQY